MKNKHKLSFVVLGVGFIVGGYLFYSFSAETLPRLESNYRTKEEALNLAKAELRKLRQFSENIESVKVSLRELHIQLESAVESMPRNYDLSGLLRKLSVIAFNSGIRLSAFRPSGTSSQDEGFYEMTQVSFHLSGSFNQVMTFLDQSLHLKRIVQMDRVALRSIGGAGAGGVGNSGVGAEADITARLYRFVD